MREEEGYQVGGYESLEREKMLVRGEQLAEDLNT